MALFLNTSGGAWDNAKKYASGADQGDQGGLLPVVCGVLCYQAPGHAVLSKLHCMLLQPLFLPGWPLKSTQTFLGLCRLSRARTAAKAPTHTKPLLPATRVRLPSVAGRGVPMLACLPS